MRTERQILASRANGAKSRGPITPQGKRNSSSSTLDHSLLARTLILDGESAEALAALSEKLHAELDPQSEIELGLVENIVMCRWRQMRLWNHEIAGMNYEVRRQTLVHESETKVTRAALAFRALSDDSCSLESLSRCEARFDRQQARNHQRLLEAQTRRRAATLDSKGHAGMPPDKAA